ncbi:HupE/UreJ family protein [Aquifex sp.]
MKKALALSLTTAGLAIAHPLAFHLQNPFQEGVLHPVTGLDHLLAAVAVGLVGSYYLGRKALGLIALFPAFMLAGTLLGFKGIALPFAELGVILSIALLGVMLLSESLKFLIPAVALFGIIHGNLHGLEAPSFGHAEYAAGLLLSTITLHLIGYFVGERLSKRFAKAFGYGLLASALFLL